MKKLLVLALPLALVAASHAPPGPITNVRIDAFNYGYRVPRIVRHGQVAFQLVNIGSVPHEVQIFRFKKGIGADSAGKIIPGGVPDSLGDSFGAVLIGGPGQTVTERVLIDAKKDEVYALICEFRDKAGAPHHRELGMFAVVTIN